MMASVDGRIVSGGWPLSFEERRADDILWLRYRVEVSTT
jgi:hypothetical protein